GQSVQQQSTGVTMDVPAPSAADDRQRVRPQSGCLVDGGPRVVDGLVETQSVAAGKAASPTDAGDRNSVVAEDFDGPLDSEIIEFAPPPADATDPGGSAVDRVLCERLPVGRHLADRQCGATGRPRTCDLREVLVSSVER